MCKYPVILRRNEGYTSYECKSVRLKMQQVSDAKNTFRGGNREGELRFKFALWFLGSIYVHTAIGITYM